MTTFAFAQRLGRENAEYNREGSTDAGTGQYGHGHFRVVRRSKAVLFVQQGFNMFDGICFHPIPKQSKSDTWTFPLSFGKVIFRIAFIFPGAILSPFRLAPLRIVAWRMSFFHLNSANKGRPFHLFHAFNIKFGGSLADFFYWDHSCLLLLSQP